ncbi:MAG: SdpI family protein [Pseudomonadota bacterium]
MIRTGLAWTGGLFVVAVAISLAGAVVIPEDAVMPRRWGFDGEPTGYMARDMLLILMPAVVLGVGLLLAVLPLIDPRGENLRKSAGFYLAAWIGGLMITTAVHGMVVYAAATGTNVDARYVFVGTGLFIAVIGDRMAKSRSNWFAGLRTPWTLSSEHAWGVGNRWSGRLLVLTGLLSAGAAVLAGAAASAAALTAGVLTAVVAGTVASWLAWRSDPEASR